MQWFATVRFDNGDVLTTRINGTREEIEEYYAPGKLFNLGSRYDRMHRVEKIHEICEIAA